MSKLVAVKIIQTYTQLILGWLVLLFVFPARLFIKNFNGQEVVKLLRR